LSTFISLVFKDDRIKTITDARKHIEEEFDSNYLVDRDLLSYLKHKQDKQPMMHHLPPEPKSLPKRKSMMEDDYCDEDEEEMAMMREQMRNRRNMFMDEGEEDEEMMEIDEGSRH
jgi:hypothetical protein